jgi:hypothetical protein
MPPNRWPKGYVGRNHETIGSDILAVRDAVRSPEQILGHETRARLEQVRPSGWYPIGWLLDLMEELDQHLGRPGLRQMGRKLFNLSHKERVLQVAKSARDICYGIDGMYHHANRGDRIGGWRVITFAPGRCELEKTTPHHCAMEEGILLEALAALGVPGRVDQSACFRNGAEACIYEIGSVIADARWTGAGQP